MKIVTTVVGILGIILTASPSVLDASTYYALNAVLVGRAITTHSRYNYSHGRTRNRPSQVVSGLVGLLGVGVSVAPFLVEATGPLRWAGVAIGVLVTAFAGRNTCMAPLEDQISIRNPSDEKPKLRFRRARFEAHERRYQALDSHAEKRQRRAS